PTVMSNGNHSYEFYDAMVNYKQGKYKLAIEKWEEQLNLKPQNDTLNYFIGMAYMAERKEALSIPFLSKVSKRSESTFKDETNYYLGLVYLKEGDIELAKKYLELSSTKNSRLILSELNP
ncbi:MAG: hypothetical protein AAF901_13130, partial [Bacteroidota bacterium]